MYFWEIQFSLANLAHYEVTTQAKEENPYDFLNKCQRSI